DLVGFAARLREDSLALPFDAGELRVDLLRVLQALRDLPAAFVEHPQNRLVGKPVQNRADDREADDLRRQVRPVDAEGLGERGDLVHRRLTSRGTARRTRSLPRT